MKVALNNYLITIDFRFVSIWEKTPEKRYGIFAVTILNVGIMMVDSKCLDDHPGMVFEDLTNSIDIHFQYNGFLLGWLILSVTELIQVN